MLIKEKNVLIVSIDHGFCSIKGPHFVMENGVTRIPTVLVWLIGIQR